MIFFYFMGWALIISGGIFVVTGAIGCLKFDNFFSALHAASVADNGGMILILLGIIC
jgi:multicomponent Na+:H+ antiporter subunit G